MNQTIEDTVTPNDLVQQIPMTPNSVAVDPTLQVKHQAGVQFTRLVTRDDAKMMIRMVRSWFENNEPSSPVADLLGQAEHLVGKSYIEVIDAIPIELLKTWKDWISTKQNDSFR
jgi:predicted component of type VI protein secretion system